MLFIRLTEKREEIELGGVVRDDVTCDSDSAQAEWPRQSYSHQQPVEIIIRWLVHSCKLDTDTTQATVVS